jgi:hypothetical protein
MEEIKYNIIPLITELLDRPLAFNRAFAKLLGEDVKAGILLSQLFYWAKTKNFEEFYKLREELQYECCLNRREFENARAKIVNKKILNISKRGAPQKTYYKINIDILLKLLDVPTYIDPIHTGNIPDKLTKNPKKPPFQLQDFHVSFINNNFTEEEIIQIDKWIEYKNERKDFYTPVGFKSWLSMLHSAKLKDVDIIKWIENSIVNSWKGLIRDNPPLLELDQESILHKWREAFSKATINSTKGKYNFLDWVRKPGNEKISLALSDWILYRNNISVEDQTAQLNVLITALENNIDIVPYIYNTIARKQQTIVILASNSYKKY